MNYKKKRPKVAIIMGSQSDYSTMKYTEETLTEAPGDEEEETEEVEGE